MPTEKKIMTSKSAFEISSDQKVHLVSAANKIGKLSWPVEENPGTTECIQYCIVKYRVCNTVLYCIGSDEVIKGSEKADN